MNKKLNPFKSNIKVIIFLTLSLAALLFACSNNPVSNKTETPSNYQLILNTGGDNRFELYSASSPTTLMSGYNDIGFKVFQNGQEMKSGFVKFTPRMHHNYPITSFHQTPVSPLFSYDNSKGFFMGYASFTMYTDTNAHWYGFFNYNDVMHVDSLEFPVMINPSSQIKMFVDNQSGTSFLLTLVTPMNPKQGMNDFKCLLHQTADDIYYTEIDSATMAIFPWMHLMGHGSSNNVHPVYIGNGIYSGQINCNMSGEWYVYDTIGYQGRRITPTPPPYFIIQAP